MQHKQSDLLQSLGNCPPEPSGILYMPDSCVHIKHRMLLFYSSPSWAPSLPSSFMDLWGHSPLLQCHLPPPMSKLWYHLCSSLPWEELSTTESLHALLKPHLKTASCWLKVCQHLSYWSVLTTCCLADLWLTVFLCLCICCLSCLWVHLYCLLQYVMEKDYPARQLRGVNL